MNKEIHDKWFSFFVKEKGCTWYKQKGKKCKVKNCDGINIAECYISFLEKTLEKIEKYFFKGWDECQKKLK